jgi:hypothetical protein
MHSEWFSLKINLKIVLLRTHEVHMLLNLEKSAVKDSRVGHLYLLREVADIPADMLSQIYADSVISSICADNVYRSNHNLRFRMRFLYRIARHRSQKKETIGVLT